MGYITISTVHARYPLKKKNPCMHVWYCNLNIGRQLIDHLPILFYYPIDLHIDFLTSLSIHTIVNLNISSIFCHKYICSLIVIGHNEELN